VELRKPHTGPVEHKNKKGEKKLKQTSGVKQLTESFGGFRDCLRTRKNCSRGQKLRGLGGAGEEQGGKMIFALRNQTKKEKKTTYGGEKERSRMPVIERGFVRLARKDRNF